MLPSARTRLKRLNVAFSNDAAICNNPGFKPGGHRPSLASHLDRRDRICHVDAAPGIGACAGLKRGTPKWAFRERTSSCVRLRHGPSTMTFFGAPVLGRLSDRIGRKVVLLVCAGGIVASYITISA